MRFLIDAHHIGARATGNETWVFQVARATELMVEGSGGKDEVLLAVAPAGQAGAGRGAVVGLGHGSLRRLVWDLPRALRRERVDAVLVQYTAPLSRTPSVVAIHDLSFAHPASRKWIPTGERARMRATIGWSASRAGRIIALSEYTSKDLQEQWSIDPARIVVAYPAVGSERRELLRAGSGVSRTDRSGPRTVLAVGNLLPRKNLSVLALAVRTLRRRGLNVLLRLVGQATPGSRVGADLSRLCGDWLTMSGYVGEAELISAYHGADVFCFPSLYEGFGLPVLEAMTAGVPTIVSSATALPEAAGDAGAVVDPHDVTGWADVLERVLTDEGLANRMRAAGFAHAERFDWESTARKVLDALRSVAS